VPGFRRYGSCLRLPLLGLFFLYLSGYGAHRDLHSFPTRRSSDLKIGDRVFITYNSLVRGWMSVVGIQHFPNGFVCSTTGVHWPRSEEHTSELQSREKLVCRLLLEKKKRRGAQRNAHRGGPPDQQR